MSTAFWLRYGAAVVTVCAALWMLARVARKLRARSARQNGEVLCEVASVALSPTVSAYIVRAAEREFLVVAGASVCALEDSASATNPKQC